ncbi:GDP dissociation inhibitor family protein [Tritrichomonas foetus]|uniref:GDP dissociation inhibitor family protein n=1 Tax=Tritrichomonas foetus TaxID=1144522 RepID=A0A1J4L3R9_9EUKA|nr:GDP dissociation inhibitor family protein [Tritrichomonas foetus]|eukprot:OHT16620.1 GDP dissociation inhibitor family protein [Tritrichomonas foetus]
MELSELQGEYDVIIAGTGLTESLISGCLAQSGKKLINFDKYLEYGGFLKTKGINDFITWVNEHGEFIVNRVEEKLGTNLRNGAYCFDIFPIAVFSRDKIIQILINSKGFESLTTYLIEGLFFRTKDSFRAIPSSKSSIFSEKSIPVRQKRAVMKFIAYFLPEEEYGHAIDTEEIEQKVEEYKDKPFNELLKALNFDDDLAQAFEYFVALARDPLLTKDAVPRIREFLNSFGRWGPTPFVEFSYGASESPQLFARHSAVFGGIFILNHFPQKIERDEDNDQLILTVDGIGTIKTKTLVASSEHLESTGESKFIGYREVLLTSKRLLDSDRAVSVIAPNVMGNEKPVYIFQFDDDLRCCQEGQYVIHFSSMAPIRDVVDKIASDIGEDDLILRAAFTLTENIPKEIKGVYSVISPSVEEVAFGTNYFIEAAEKYMKETFPDVEFYPKPTEVEIVVEEE